MTDDNEPDTPQTGPDEGSEGDPEPPRYTIYRAGEEAGREAAPPSKTTAAPPARATAPGPEAASPGPPPAAPLPQPKLAPPPAPPAEAPGAAPTPSAAPAAAGATPNPQSSKRQPPPEPTPSAPVGGDAKPAYSVYRSRRSPLSRFRDLPLGAAAERVRERPKRAQSRPATPVRAAASLPATELDPPSRARPPWRRILRWALIAAFGWLALSFVLFVISAHLQQSKFDGGANGLLGGGPLPLINGQTILVIGTDARPAGTDLAEDSDIDTRPECVDRAAKGTAPGDGCGGYRADTLMLVHGSAGRFSKLSIPRDTYAAIPGQINQKINAAYAFGGAELQIETVEQFLGIDINHAVIVDFEGFANFIDALGGVTVNNITRLDSKIDGGSSQGGITLKLERGDVHLDGQRALAYARTRKNDADPSENDLDRARRQQAVLNGIKDRLTSPSQLPINFLRAPWIAWNAPKAMVSDMSGFTLLQLGISSATGGSSETKILSQGVTPGPGGSLFFGAETCRKAVNHLLGTNPDGKPACSPTG